MAVIVHPDAEFVRFHTLLCLVLLCSVAEISFLKSSVCIKGRAVNLIHSHTHVALYTGCVRVFAEIWTKGALRGLFVLLYLIFIYQLIL